MEGTLFELQSAALSSRRLRKPAGTDAKVELEPGINSKHENKMDKRHANRPQSLRVLGLETRAELVWEDWQEGREFTKTLVMKNIQDKLHKLHVRPPKSPFFSALAPQTLFISPGTSVSIPVTFKPLQRCEYEDDIGFRGKDGELQVSLRAVLPCHILEAPSSVMLPLCAVQHSSHASFMLKNPSNLKTFFQWECALPFQLSPDQGLLAPSQERLISVGFLPAEALVYQRTASCWFGAEAASATNRCTVLLKALAKYPYLQLRDLQSNDEDEKQIPTLHFGSVALGQSLQKSFGVFNPSPVTASFSLSTLSDGSRLFGSEFSCDVIKGEVAPGGSQWVTVTYSPSGVDGVSVEVLSLQCRGGLSHPRVRLCGSGVGPKVCVSTSVVNFGCVQEGESFMETLELINLSAATAVYHWDIDCTGNSVFRLRPAGGAVPPHGSITLKALYTPTQPNAHYRRVACLLLHGEPVFVDLIGTCHSERQQPVILKPEHLVSHRLHSQREGALNASRPNWKGKMDPQEVEKQVSVVPTELRFNQKRRPAAPPSTSASQCVSITNRSSGKLSLVWTVSQDSPFSLHPSSCDLAPLKSTSFTVTYNPKQLHALHGAQLECFAYSQLDAVDGRPLACARPPWCVTVRVIGHSFQPRRKHFLPVCSLKPSKVVFPPLSATSYRTVLLHNEGDLPVTFCLDRSSNPDSAESTSVAPSCGLIQPSAHQILTIRASPTDDGPTEGYDLHLQLNAHDFTKQLRVVSVVEKPRVSLEGGTILCFQPADVGSQTQRILQIRNCSSLPIRFEWSIPEPNQNFISVERVDGELPANDILAQTWTFTPLEEREYSADVTLSFWYQRSDGISKDQLSLTVVGLGAEGFIEAGESVVDVGEVLVGSYRSVGVPLVNSSPCPVSFLLTIEQKLMDDSLILDSDDEQTVLQLDCEQGTIASHSTTQLLSTVQPHRRAQYIWTISYQKVNANGSVPSAGQRVCEVRAKGVFPTLQVMDVCAAGRLGELRKAHLWKLFSLDDLNEQLLSEPSPAKLNAKHSWPPVFSQIPLDFNFSSSPVNSDPSGVTLMFHNPGSVPVDWAFVLPEDHQIELECWAATGEFSTSELSEMKVQENRRFNVAPRSGTLLPGQKRAVHFSYCHDFVGTDGFPVVFKLTYGKEMLIKFKGVTAERETPYLHFYSQKHVFVPVLLGDFSPPKQRYELHNGGGVPVLYRVDTSVMSQLQMGNFNHPVLSCLNPEGQVLPGKAASLEWIFSPLEAKVYHIDVPIHVQDGDTTVVRFEGLGCKTLGPSQSSPQSDGPPDSTRGVQRVPFPGQVLFLSEDSVLLGDIPVSTNLSRILFLTNVSYTDTLYFSWEQDNVQSVQLHPDRGFISPGKCSLCVLTFISSNYPTAYQLHLTCQVFLEAALIQYQKDLHSWEEERERQQNEFIITDKPKKSIIIATEEDATATPPFRNGARMKKYKTLPPIAAKRCGVCSRAEQRVWRRPKAPRPTLLHLEVTAHSHGLLQYQTRFPDQFTKFYRHKKLVDTPDKVSVEKPERENLEWILSSVLRDVLDDSTFFQLLSSLHLEPNTCRMSSSDNPTGSSAQSHTLIPTSPTRPAQLPAAERKGLGSTPAQREAAGIRRAPVAIVDDILMNALQNQMMEAVRGELDLVDPTPSTPCPRRRLNDVPTEEDV